MVVTSQKQAILVVSFGTSYLDTLEKSIVSIEQEIGKEMPELTLRRAFTSEIILRKLRNQYHIQIDNVPQALSRLEQEGFLKVVMQPTHIISGEEYDKLCRQADPFRNRMEISVGTPLLTSVQDYRNAISAIMNEIEAPADDEAIVFMGHGTAHYANATYALMDYMFHDFGWDRAFVGTVEGYPELEQVVSRLGKMPQIHRVRLYPLLVVAGDHATNDMAGTDEDSWRSQLQRAGYEVSCMIQGLGEYASIRRLFVQHAKAALQPEI